MNKILLLEGPDGNKYKGTLLQRGIWSVTTFANMSKKRLEKNKILSCFY
jgi:hypothetical protein